MQTYDSALARLKEIVARLEADEPLSLEQYKALATEAKTLLSFCREQLTSIEQQTKSLFEE